MAETPFHPLIRDWFRDRKGTPTDVQDAAWPAIARGEHVLVTAPTGSGKTLTAFLWALDRLATGAWSGNHVRVLYISPLKALNTDVRENLIQPLAELRERFTSAGHPMPAVRVLTRSGDTPQQDRRRMLRHPPEILITTPESLNLLLSSKSGCLILGRLKTVILDEIHACAGSKRGVHLMSGVERLVRLSGEFQRIALSATLENPEAVARMVGGYRFSGRVAAYIPRPVTRIASALRKEYRLEIVYPRRPDPDEAGEDYSVWDLLAESLVDRIKANRATLIFTNGRRLCEKLAFKINQAAGRLAAYAHHGSLSRELRQDVEARLRSGGLRAIVATSSLEMGIDIGELDEVIMVQSPFSVSSAVQRLGRAGHRVGVPSPGRLFPAHVQDLIPCAVLARAAREGDIEPLVPVEAPLDVLAQILISMTAMEVWDIDDLFAFVRTMAPFHILDRTRFDLVLNMLAGYYERTRIRELKSRVSVDRTDNTVTAKRGALLALYMSGGTIPDRGYYKLRHARTGARIGELDEEYVWEAKIGQIATVGSQNWKISRITHDDVFALPAGNRGMDAPFWIAEGMNRDFHFSCRMGAFLESADAALDGGKSGREAFARTLVSDYSMDDRGARELVRFCRDQRRAAPLPHRRRIVLEFVRSGPGSSPGTMLVIHTLWGGRVNRPFALALEGAWQDRFGERPEVFPGNDAVIVQLPGPVDPETVISLVTRDNVDDLVCRGLEGSGFFGARFRECAGRALLVTRNRINQRMPLWMTRLHAQKLMENVLPFKAFPILLETWRTCIRDEFDMPALHRVLEELAAGEISWATARTARPSPFAAAMAWNQINQYMYQPDQPASGRSDLADDLIRDILHGPDLRPELPGAIVDEFQTKRQRLAPGYAPDSPRDLIDWVRDRVAIPRGEWEALLRSMAENSDRDRVDALLDGVRKKLVEIRTPAAVLIAAGDKVDEILPAWYGGGDMPQVLDMGGDPASLANPAGLPQPNQIGQALLAQWLSYYGPVSEAFCQKALGLDQGRLEGFLSELSASEDLVSGGLTEDGTDPEICDTRNFEILLRMLKNAARPDFDPLDPGMLPLFLARNQGLVPAGGQDSLDHLFDSLARLTCLPLPAGLWESDILPARVAGYHPSFLDSILQAEDMVWLGREKEKILFCFNQDLDLLDADRPPETDADQSADPWAGIFQSPGTAHEFYALGTLTGKGSRDLAKLIWQTVWQGRLSNHGFTPVRRGIDTRFRLPGPGPASQGVLSRGVSSRGRRRGRYRPRVGGQPAMAGLWFRPAPDRADAGDLVAQEELNRERARLLLDRYGIVFRELLARELPGFRWADLFKTLYLMELSGEVVAGSFFKAVEGPQFMTPGAFSRLRTGLDREAVFWMNAADPASACGLGPVARGLPRRLPGTHLVYRGEELVLVSAGKGKTLTISVPPEDPELPRFFAPLVHMLERTSQPMVRITVETINGSPAAGSPYRSVLGTLFETDPGPRSLDLFRRRDHGAA